MLLKIALLLMTAIVLAFVIAWMRSPQLRRTLEEPKYRLFDEDAGEEQSH
ncbi:hypothetical protein BH10CYA1_BH10CYA1_36380 [soil metagenome]